MKASFHGSPKESGSIHGGKVAGAGELTVGIGPGSAAKKTRIDAKDLGINKDSGAASKGMKKK